MATKAAATAAATDSNTAGSSITSSRETQSHNERNQVIRREIDREAHTHTQRYRIARTQTSEYNLFGPQLHTNCQQTSFESENQDSRR
jgi:hypothetical protein